MLTISNVNRLQGRDRQTGDITAVQCCVLYSNCTTVLSHHTNNEQLLQVCLWPAS